DAARAPGRASRVGRRAGSPCGRHGRGAEVPAVAGDSPMMTLRTAPHPPANFGPAWLRLALAAAFLVGGCGKHGDGEKGGDEEKSPPPLVQVHTVPLTHRSFVDQVLAPGEWCSSDEIVIGAPFAGTVLELKPRLGDRVAAGSTIAW